MSEKPLLFTHIPKCGGSSIRESVRARLGADLFSAYDGEAREEVQKRPLVTVRGRRAVFGHFPFPIHPQLVGSCRYFTVLRDPVERVISYLAYHRWNETAPFRQHVAGLSDRDALTVLLSPRFGVADEMCRYFGRPGDSLAAFQVARRHYDHVGHVEDIGATFDYLKAAGVSDGAAVHVNSTREPLEIGHGDRAYIRAQVMEDIRLHDMLAGG